MNSIADSKWSEQKEEHLESKTKSCQQRRTNADVESFQRNWSTSQILMICQIRGVSAKNLEVTFLYVNVFKAFESMHREKNGVNTSSLWSLQRNCYSHNVMFYRKTKVKVQWMKRQTSLTFCCWSFGRRYIRALSVYNLRCDKERERAHPHPRWVY